MNIFYCVHHDFSGATTPQRAHARKPTFFFFEMLQDMVLESVHTSSRLRLAWPRKTARTVSRYRGSAVCRIWSVPSSARRVEQGLWRALGGRPFFHWCSTQRSVFLLCLLRKVRGEKACVLAWSELPTEPQARVLCQASLVAE